MARTYTPIDVHAHINALVKQLTGEQNITVVDTSTFMSAAELVMTYSTTNVLNALTQVIGRTMIAARPYEKARLAILNALDTGMYTSRMRKISLYSKGAKPTGHLNTNLYTNLAMGYDNMENGAKSVGQGNNSTKSMWEQEPPIPLEVNFGGTSTWDTVLTTYKHALKAAFRSESEFAAFIAGIYTEKMNDIAQMQEAWNRSVLLNGIGATYNMNNAGSVINLTAEYNKKFGTAYTSQELRTTYLDSFLKFFISVFKTTSNLMTYRTAKYHWSPAKQVNGVDYTLLRHTPLSKQRALMYNPLFLDAKTSVLPEIFHPSFLEQGMKFETVDFWQEFDTESFDGDSDAARVKVKPAQTNKSTGAQEVGAEVDIPYLVGVLYDVDAMMTDFQLDDVETTVMESRKRYQNTWFTFARNGIVDPTENFCLFVMTDED